MAALVDAVAVFNGVLVGVLIKSFVGVLVVVDGGWVLLAGVLIGAWTEALVGVLVVACAGVFTGVLIGAWTEALVGVLVVACTGAVVGVSAFASGVFNKGDGETLRVGVAENDDDEAIRFAVGVTPPAFIGVVDSLTEGRETGVAIVAVVVVVVGLVAATLGVVTATGFADLSGVDTNESLESLGTILERLLSSIFCETRAGRFYKK